MKVRHIFSGVASLLVLVFCVSQNLVLAQGNPLTHKDFRTSILFLPDAETTKLNAGNTFLTRVGQNVGPNVQVNEPQEPFPNGLLGRSETTIASDPTGLLLLAGWNDAEGFCAKPFNAGCDGDAEPGLSGFGFSSDGGQTWIDAGTPFVFEAPDPQGVIRGVVTRGDPWLDTGGPGQKTYFYANLGVFDDGPFSPAALFPAPAGVTVHRGQFTDGSFNFTDAVLIQSPNFPDDFLDKEAMCAGKTPQTQDQVVVSVTNFIEVDGEPFFGFGQIEAYTSTDGAATFARTIVQPDETISVEENDGIVNQGSTCAISREGKIFVAWQRGFLSPFFG